MRAMRRVAILLAIATLLAGCAKAAPTATPTSPASPLGLDPAPWQGGSSADYQWLSDSDDSSLGTSSFTFALSDGAWTITETDDIQGVQQTIAMKINADTLQPLGETKTIKAPGNDIQVTTTYVSSTLSITATVNGQTSSASIDVPSNAIDNDQLLMTLRALPFAQGYKKVDYVAVVAQNALKVPITVSVVGQESIDVPAGTFDVWRVDTTASSGTQSAWYGVAAPHPLVEYDNGTNRMVLTQQQ